MFPDEYPATAKSPPPFSDPGPDRIDSAVDEFIKAARIWHRYKTDSGRADLLERFRAMMAAAAIVVGGYGIEGGEEDVRHRRVQDKLERLRSDAPGVITYAQTMVEEEEFWEAAKWRMVRRRLDQSMH